MNWKLGLYSALEGLGFPKSSDTSWDRHNKDWLSRVYIGGSPYLGKLPCGTYNSLYRWNKGSSTWPPDLHQTETPHVH